VARRPIPILQSYAALIVLAIGVSVSVIAYRISAQSVQRRIEAEFFRSADVQHTLTREVLNYYGAGLFGLRNLFLADRQPTRDEFDRAAKEIVVHYSGVASLEWATVIAGADRTAFEAEMSSKLGRPVQISKTGGDGPLVPVESKPYYTPVTFIYPTDGKEVVFGFDITTGKIAEAVERAGRDRTLMVSSAVKLLESPDRGRIGLVWIWPIFRSTDVAAPPTGYVLGVFRLNDMLDESLRRESNTDLELLYVDPAQTEAEQRVLYYQTIAPGAPVQWPSEQEFRRSAFFREQPLAIGGKTWAVLYRPSILWLHEHQSHLSLWLLVTGLVLSGMASGWVFQFTRRAAVVEDLVDARTKEVIESRRELASFLHALPGMAFRGRYDEQFTLFYVSDGATALTGYAPEDFIAGRVHLRDLIHPDDLANVRAATLAALTVGHELAIEYRLRTRDGREKWVLCRGHGRRSDDENINYFEGIALDITPQKLAEIERIGFERKLLEGQKLESLGLLAGGIAHDFNNLLTGILGNANLARLGLPAGSTLHSHLHAIESASLRAAELCRQMLAYAGKGRFVVEPVDLSALVEGLVPLLRISIGQRAELQLSPTRGLPPVTADATQLRQIVMNLVLNSADAIATHPGKITITTGTMRADAALLAQCAAGADRPAGEYVFIEIRDNGVGMAPEIRAKIFEPFFTTKFAGRGLGLAAALGIVRSHQGALQVESTPGKGSSFRLLLPPNAAADARPAAPCASAPAGWRRTGQVLVIDDEESVHQVAAEMLASFGFTPRAIGDGKSGLAAFRERSAQIEVVLLDLVMPGMNGEQTLEGLRQIRRDVRVLLMSGYTEGELLRRFGPERGRLAFLSKPFTREGLADKLRELLG